MAKSTWSDGDTFHASDENAIATEVTADTAAIAAIAAVSGLIQGNGAGSYSAVSVPVAVANGGTGASTLTGLVKGSGTSALTAVAAPTGTVVGTSDTQTLTNKTLTSATLTSPVISSISNTGTLTLPTSTDTLVGRATTDTLTNKTLTNPTINGFTEGVTASGTVTSNATLSIANGTILTATLTASTACTFTMPTAAAGKSFTLLLKQPGSTGNGSATFTSVKWPGGLAPTITTTAGTLDMLSFISDGTNWYGSFVQGFTY